MAQQVSAQQCQMRVIIVPGLDLVLGVLPQVNDAR